MKSKIKIAFEENKEEYLYYHEEDNDYLHRNQKKLYHSKRKI